MSGSSRRRFPDALTTVASLIEIGGKALGAYESCFVVAEIGVNHGGDLSTALRLVDAAATTGADAVKTQTFTASGLASPTAQLAPYQVRTGGPSSQSEMLSTFELSPADHKRIQEHAISLGLVFFSSPFDPASVDLLDDLEVPAFKIASGELVNDELLRAVAGRGKPVLLSTGMCTMAEVARALSVLKASGEPPIVLLHCVSGYPVPPEAANLSAISTMRAEFDLPVGYSDHTNSLEVVLGAVALGCVIVEEHLTLDRSMEGPDHLASLEPAEFTRMVESIRLLGAAMGDGEKRPSAVERELADAVRRSLVAARDLPAGHVLTREDVVALRPGTGMPPSSLDDLIGRRLLHPVAEGTLFTLEAFG